MPTRGVIIVADDDEAFRDIVELVLQDAGYAVFTAGAADGVLALLERGVRPCLIVCDLNMPGLGVPELVETLGADARTLGALVAVMTGARNAVLPSKAIRLEKPFELGVLLELARRASTHRGPAACAGDFPLDRAG